jgi:xanthine dehydrogenase molybdopterin-binding subunit B
MLGGRRAFEAEYTAAVDPDGAITAVQMKIYAHSGATGDFNAD